MKQYDDSAKQAIYDVLDILYRQRDEYTKMAIAIGQEDYDYIVKLYAGADALLEVSTKIQSLIIGNPND